MRVNFPITLMLLAFSYESASAGVVMTFSRTELATKVSTPVTVYADPDKLKVESADNTLIYRDDQKKVLIVSPGRKSYTEISSETIQQLAGPAAALMAQMQARMANLPPAQRAQMEAMMSGMGLSGAAAKPPVVNYDKLDASKRIANVPCAMYSKTVGGRHDQDLCIATIGAAGLNAGDLKALDNVGALVEQVSTLPVGQRANEFNWAAMNRTIGFTGIPLEVTEFSGGKPVRQTTAQKIERASISADVFEVPADYTRQAVPMGR